MAGSTIAFGQTSVEKQAIPIKTMSAFQPKIIKTEIN